MMACAMKFSAGAVRNQLRHNRRTIEHSSNRDIDPERLEHDYVLSPDRGMTEYDYFCSANRNCTATTVTM